MNLENSKAAGQWKKVGIKHHHGINIPLFSLITEKSSGIGEYKDLIPLIDFCAMIGFDVIQLLPLNDTGHETSPYNAISAFALNPIHISCSSLPLLDKVPDAEEKLSILRKYNASPKVKYEPVRELKQEFLKEYFNINGSEISKTPEYGDFIQKNTWLKPYALFKAIKESQNDRSWEEWHENWKNMNPFLIPESLQKECDFHMFLQFLCFKEMIEVKNYATSKGIWIKGDIPILINRDSADVWANKDDFLLQYAAGAPPDMYAKEGQYWGFPLYNWANLEKKEFQFWKERLKTASLCYHLYRLDHVVGFFRLWAIPRERKASDGAFIPKEEKEWVAQGKKIMEILLENPMLPIAEDLGTVPSIVRTTLRELGIPTTKVMRWERRWEEDQSFIPPSEYIPESMTTVSTHDSDTLQLWWRHFPKEAQAYSQFKGWDYKPFLSIDRRLEILKDSHTSASLFHINLFNEYLALFPELVSPNPHDERINTPGKVLSTNWTYKLPFPLSKLFSHPLLIPTMKAFIP